MTPAPSAGPTGPIGPDRHRLDDLIRLTFDQLQSSEKSDHDQGPGISVEQIAQRGPYSVQQIADHLAAESETCVVRATTDGLRIVGFKGQLDQ